MVTAVTTARKVLGRCPGRPALERVQSRVVPIRWRSFTAEGRKHRYFVHPYNPTWRSERAVEIPLALDFLARTPGRGVEIGNVLDHYVPTTHRRVDKYEVAPGVENIDVLDLRSDPLDWIVAISTLEHVGWDESPRDPTKAVRAVEHLRALLRPEGRLFLSVPVGHNPGLDAAMRAGLDGTVRSIGLVRGPRSRWTEVDKLPDVAYDVERHAARAVWIGELTA